MLKLIVFAGLALAVWAATTVTAPTAQILYDMKHHKAIIVNAVGCFEYSLEHQDMLDVEAGGSAQQALEVRILGELAMASRCEEMGHNHGNHFTAEIQAACLSLPYFKFTNVDNSTGIDCP